MTFRRGLDVSCIFVAILAQFLAYSHAIQRSHFCQSAQRGEVGKTGIINCKVTKGFVGVYWFEESNERDPLIRYEVNTIGGRGFRSGEYNILPNGSLIINTVSAENDMSYKLIVIDEMYSDFEEVVRFEVIEMQRSSFCQATQRGEVGKTSIIKCNVTKGFLEVYWFEESNERDPLITYEGNTIGGRGFRSREYNILSNGSLVINTVSAENDMYYKLIVTDASFTNFEEAVRFEVIGGNFSKHQQGRLGTRAIIGWHINPGFEGVYWFDERNEKEPVVRHEGGIKSGRLYKVEYDINDDGWLIIQNVSSEHHNRVYKLLVIDANYKLLEEELRFSVVDLQSTGQTETRLPTIMPPTKLPVSPQPPQSSKSSQPSEQPHTPELLQPSNVSQSSQTTQLSQPPQGTSASLSAEYKISSSTKGDNVMTSSILEPSRTPPSTTDLNLSEDDDHNNGSHRMLSCQYLQLCTLLSSVMLTNMKFIC